MKDPDRNYKKVLYEILIQLFLYLFQCSRKMYVFAFFGKPFCRKGSKKFNLVWISLKWIKTKRKTKKKFFSKVPFFCTGTSKTLYWRPGISANMCYIKNLIHAFCRSALVLYKRKKIIKIGFSYPEIKALKNL